ncbi:MAG: hypothetical protein M1821_007081 [Bathelium mastoideum]|nr:MAG: hypothetical protein M1821_007081 [Bathelium mastoideum]
MSAVLTLQPESPAQIDPFIAREQNGIDALSPIWKPSPSKLKPECHPRVEEVTQSVNDRFLNNWPFPNDKARKKFIGAGFPRVTSLYFPLAREDRIEDACLLLTILFLVDDELEDMSLTDGAAYNAKLMTMCRGEDLPDRSRPVEWIMYDLWESMRAKDSTLVKELEEPVFLFMRAQTSKDRLQVNELGQYLTYRQGDVGQALLAALMRYSMSLHLTADEVEAAKEVELNLGRHISIVNDIYSFEKELKASKTGHMEGGALCSAVSVLSTEVCISYDASKHVLWTLCREYEDVHERLVARIAGDEVICSDTLRLYLKGLEYQMSGNELWSRTTKRYQSSS